MKVEVEITKKIFFNGGWGIFGAKPINKEDKAKLKIHPTFGNFSFKGTTGLELVEGERYTIELGEYEESPKGNSYNLIQVQMPKITSYKAQYVFLKTILPPNTYNEFVKKFPLKSKRKVIEEIKNGTIKLTDVKGIGKKNSKDYMLKILRQEEKIHIINKLSPIGVSDITIEKIIEHYGSIPVAIKKINESMYNLCEVSGLGFKTVDSYALTNGENREGFKRIEACINYLIHEHAKEGHSWTPYEDMCKEASKLLDIDKQHLEAFLMTLDCVPDSIILNINDEQVTSKFYYEQEKEILRHLQRIDKHYSPISNDNILLSCIAEAESELGLTYTDEQRECIIESFQYGVYTINGKGGTGKCIKGDSLVFTDKGLIKIEDIPSYYNVNEENETTAKIISYDTMGNKELLDTSHFYNMGMNKTYKIRTVQGFEIEGTPEHPLLIVNENGDLAFKELQHFNGKEVIPISINNQLFGSNTTVGEDEAYFMGLLTGDGWTNGANTCHPTWQFTLTNSVKQIGDEFKRIAKESFNVEVTDKIDGNTVNYYFFGKKNIKYIKDTLGLSCGIAKDKCIPNTIMTAPKEIVKAFIQGLFDTDGAVVNNMIEFSTASETMVKQLHVMLLNFGIVTKLRTKYVKGYTQPYFIISTSNRNSIKKFYEEIGFKNEVNKQLKLLNLTQLNSKQNDNLNILTNMNDKIYDIHKYLIQQNIATYRKKYKYQLPIADGSTRTLHYARENKLGANGRRCSSSSKLVNEVLHNISDMKNVPNFDYLMNITENTFIDYVDTITESEANVYDFTVPKNHSFVANGIINHNTAILKGISEVCNRLNLHYQAIALSGRASQLLSVKGIEASTIHRLLGYNGSEGFSHNEKVPLPQKVIILEEASMVNAYLWKSVVQAIEDGAKLIIVGDSGQLSGIGNGDVLRDLLQTQYFNGRELMQIHRQAQGSGIIEVAGQIRDGLNMVNYIREGTNYANQQLSQSYGKNEDLVAFTYAQRDELHASAYKIIRSQMEKLTNDTIMDFQILVSNRSKGDMSALSINKFAQVIYNDTSQEKISNGTYDFHKGDKVIVTGNKYRMCMYETINDYVLDSPIMIEDEEGGEKQKEFALYNGTMGVVVSMTLHNNKEIEDTILIKFEGNSGYMSIPKSELSSIDLAYAITFHKAQGVTINNVLVLLDFGAFKLLSRQLVYTGITRASTKCVLLAEHNALYKAIRTDNSLSRNTFLGEMIEKVKYTQSDINN